MKDENLTPISDIERQNIPNIEIADPYAYVTASKVIAILSIKGNGGEKNIRKLFKTKKGGYVMM